MSCHSHRGRSNRTPSGAAVAAIAATCLGTSAIAPASDMRFTDVTKASGIEWVMTCGRLPASEILEVDGGGVAFIDFDNDGDLDLFFANGATMKDPENGPGSRLFANRGDGTFEDVTEKLGIRLTRWAMGAAVGDFDGDGWDDIYVTCYGPDVLLRNECFRKEGPRFVDVSAEAGISRDHRWGASAGFGDIDGDGDLDLYVANYLEFDVKNPPARTEKTFKGVPVMAGPAGLIAEDDILYENLGGGKFRDITKAAGIVEEPPGYGLGVRLFDFDSDGRLDIFVGNDSSGNYLFRNLGEKKFEDIAIPAGVFANLEGTTQASMGIGLADVDGNGHPDLFTTNFSSDTNTLFLNLGDGFFDDRTAQFGLGLISRPFLSWGCGFFDFDHDGDEDLFIASGHVYPEAATQKIDSEWAQDLLMFERNGKRFQRITDCGEMFARKFHGRATAFGDIDGDGDIDIVMTTLNGPVYIFRNDSKPRDWLIVEPDGPKGNHRGYGSMVELRSSAGTQRRWITGGGSFQSTDAPSAHFGLGDFKRAENWTVVVRFPDGKLVNAAVEKPNRRMRIAHPSRAGK
ncbi:MAG: CRTAC1 family protein [Phycisphaerae bacterium]|nr:CRTAC1 family protein [Phycisphaerae bacterium]